MLLAVKPPGWCFAVLSCARWRGGHATVEQVGAYSFSSLELRGFAVSGGIGRAVGEASVGCGGQGDEASAPDDTLHYPTQRCVRLSQCVPRARHDSTYFPHVGRVADERQDFPRDYVNFRSNALSTDWLTVVVERRSTIVQRYSDVSRWCTVQCANRIVNRKLMKRDNGRVKCISR